MGDKKQKPKQKEKGTEKGGKQTGGSKAPAASSQKGKGKK